MLEKIKSFWVDPYYAPLTEPLRNVGNTVAKAVGRYTDAVEEAYDDRHYYGRDKSRISRIYSNILDEGLSGFGLMNLVSMIGGALVAGGAAAGATATGMAASGMAAKIGMAAVAGIAAGTVGAMAAPIVLATVVAAGAVVVGAVIGVVPGVIGGTVTALKHHKTLKNPPPAPAAAPPSAQYAQNETRAQIRGDFDRLDIHNQRSMILELERVASLTPQEKVMGAINTLSETQRVALLEEMEQKIGTAFDAVARKKAAAAAALDEDISVQPIAVKLKRRNAAPEGGAAG
ncbi:MAG: hypothetical protein Q8K65_04210 [Alphaproteobacteria bacterium]|nr:hypothetical protein [Alphaproteobacteria bacterium]